MRHLIANFALFQLGWFVCVMGGDVPALLFTVVALLIHKQFILQSANEWVTIFLVALLGIGWDWILVRGQILSFGIGNAIPVWLVCLWLLFATTLHHCLGWMQAHLGLAMVLGAFAGPLTYFAGTRLSGAEIIEPLTFSLLVIAIGWAVILPLGLSCARRLSGTVAAS